MSEIFTALVSTQEILNEIQDAPITGVEYSLAAPLENPADLLDSPLGASSPEELLQSVVAVITGVNALTQLSARILDSLKKHKSKKVSIVEPTTGSPRGEITAETTSAEVERLLGESRDDDDDTRRTA